MDITDILATMPQAPQRQDSLNDQMRDLILLANKAGMYDAADALKGQVAAADARTDRAARLRPRPRPRPIL